LKYPRYILVVILVIAFYLISCSDEPTSIGIELLNGDLVIVSIFDTMDDSISQSSSYFKEVIPLGFSSKILIGRKDDIEASTLMNFVFFIDDSLEQDFLDDNITINHAFIELKPVYTYTDESADFDFTVHEITSSWTSTGFTSDSLADLTYDMTDLSSNKNFTDTLYTFDLENEFILSWIKSYIDTTLDRNNGIYYKPAMNSGKVVGFQALTTISSDAAKLKVVIEKQGSFIDTISGFIFSDASAVNADLPVLPAGDIGVQASVTIQSRLIFDLSAVPREVRINKAELILTVDTLYSVTGSPSSTNLAAYRVTDSSSVAIDEFSVIILAKENNVYTGNITSFIDSWVTNEDNQGLVIRSASLLEGLELFAIKGSDQTQISERPRLRIVFTGKKD
jgi:hypothetical protein